MATDRPNIIYLHSHDTGRYLQPYGHAIPTPNLQHLAEQGVLFRQCFCAAPTCSPSRAALLTGQAPHSCGQLGLAHRGFELQHPERHIAHTLRRAGYLTALVGVQHVVRDAAQTGYEVIQQRAGKRSTPEITAAAIDVLRAKQERPLFLDVGYAETHRVFAEPGPAEDPRYCLPPALLPDTPESRADMAAFTATARILDSSVGAILAALDKLHLVDRTLVVSTTDHGIAFPGMKCNLTDHGIGVSLIMRGPGGFNGGLALDAMVSHLDLFPTICDLADIRRPDWLQGRSLLPLVRAEEKQLHEELFAEVSYHAAYEPQRAVRTQRWKYIRRFMDWDRPHLANCDDSPSKDLLLRYGWRERRVASEQLYDLVFDPVETHNLADDPGHATIVTDLRARLERWMRATGDPLLAGPIPMPAGGRANAIEALSPHDL